MGRASHLVGDGCSLGTRASAVRIHRHQRRVGAPARVAPSAVGTTTKRTPPRAPPQFPRTDRSRFYSFTPGFHFVLRVGVHARTVLAHHPHNDLSRRQLTRHHESFAIGKHACDLVFSYLNSTLDLNVRVAADRSRWLIRHAGDESASRLLHVQSSQLTPEECGGHVRSTPLATFGSLRSISARISARRRACSQAPQR
jgi:hypothetical protein